MGVASTVSTSRRGYLSQDELEQFANITVTDADEADDRISQAEEIIDNYVGFQDQAMRFEITGKSATIGGATTIYLNSDGRNVYQNDYFKLCEVEIIGGTGEGQRRRITASDYATGKLTVDAAWSTNPDTTSFYKIYQLGKFPRSEDVRYFSDISTAQYYKSIPEAVKRAVAAQVEYMIAMGDAFFTTDKSQMTSETISRYSYSKEAGASGGDTLVAPKVKILLDGIINRVGSIA